MPIIAFIVGLACGVALAWWMSRARYLRRSRADESRRQALAAEAADRLTELSTLTGGLAHEIRNPLSTLKVNLQLLAEDWREADDVATSDLCRRSVNKVESLSIEVNRLQEILDDFLHYIGRQELRRERADLNHLVEDLLVFFRPQAMSQKVSVLAALWSDPLICDIDVDKVKQAVLNLFVNAQQAMSQGGELMIRTSADEAGMAVVEVIDTGCGIPPDDVEKIFQPYYSTKREGTGLGLPTARRIVQAHGGAIDVHSVLDQGSSFTVRLPMTRGDSVA
ncbi:MAG: two-component sensor histidine kinase [Phycisphaerae bacterium]|nr:two-component sensor histidine kinase [Phycisphaerae bacterium]